MFLQESLTLCILIFVELILGIDNIIFISIAINKLEGKVNRRKIRCLGLLLALVFRLLMLFSISLVLHLKKPIIFIFSIKDFILFGGGLFLLFKSSSEIIADMRHKKNVATFSKKTHIILQIAFIDLVFSLDSLLAALGLTKNILLIIIAFSITMVMMATMSGYFSKYIEMFPELKTLSLAFIALIGIILILESTHIEIDKSYMYFAFFFSTGVEILNIMRRKSR